MAVGSKWRQFFASKFCLLLLDGAGARGPAARLSWPVVGVEFVC